MTTATEVKERGILFSGEMVRAILDGRKTQTRRVVEAQDRLRDGKDSLGHPGVEYYNEWGNWQPWVPHAKTMRCPHGRPGERLWVREAWAIDQCGRRVSLQPEAWPEGFPIQRLRYIATDAAPAKDLKGRPYWWNKRPSIHMPRWASRITLGITEVRAQRVQEITEEDAKAEGVPHPSELQETLSFYDGRDFRDCRDYRDVFRCVWNGLNRKRGYPFESNPWVWPITFKRLEDTDA